nr:MAG TPA: hypothetical protein [Caudoviricetes sp.]
MVNIIILIGLFLCRSGLFAFQNGPLVFVQDSEIGEALHVGFYLKNHRARETSFNLLFQLCLKFTFELSQILISFGKNKREKGYFPFLSIKESVFFAVDSIFVKIKKEPIDFSTGSFKTIYSISFPLRGSMKIQIQLT